MRYPKRCLSDSPPPVATGCRPRAWAAMPSAARPAAARPPPRAAPRATAASAARSCSWHRRAAPTPRMCRTVESLGRRVLVILHTQYTNRHLNGSTAHMALAAPSPPAPRCTPSTPTGARACRRRRRRSGRRRRGRLGCARKCTTACSWRRGLLAPRARAAACVQLPVYVDALRGFFLPEKGHHIFYR